MMPDTDREHDNCELAREVFHLPALVMHMGQPRSVRVWSAPCLQSTGSRRKLGHREVSFLVHYSEEPKKAELR